MIPHNYQLHFFNQNLSRRFPTCEMVLDCPLFYLAPRNGNLIRGKCPLNICMNHPNKEIVFLKRRF